MEIRGTNSGRFVRLDPLAYQFADLIGVEYDSDWLMIRGRARSDDEEWTFQDPSLLVGEAQDFGAWLRAAARGEAPLIQPDADGHTWPTTNTLEPNLGFGVVSYDSGSVTVRAFLRLESAPPSTWDGRSKTHMDFFIDLTTSSEALDQAADEWDAALTRFPSREKP